MLYWVVGLENGNAARSGRAEDDFVFFWDDFPIHDSWKLIYWDFVGRRLLENDVKTVKIPDPLIPYSPNWHQLYFRARFTTGMDFGARHVAVLPSTSSGSTSAAAAAMNSKLCHHFRRSKLSGAHWQCRSTRLCPNFVHVQILSSFCPKHVHILSKFCPCLKFVQTLSSMPRFCPPQIKSLSKKFPEIHSLSAFCLYFQS